MLSSLLITLREGLEAALLIGIILAYLNKTENRSGFKYIWQGVIAAIIVSIATGMGIFLLLGSFTGRAEEIFEGIAMIVATGVLTWMVIWMHRQAVNIRQNLYVQIESALTKGRSFSLAFLSFVVVVREGIELVLFLFAASRVSESALLSIVGGVIGLAAALTIGYVLYKGATTLNLRLFFNITSIFLILLAAGLLAHGIHEFSEAGIIPSVIEHVWDTNNIIAEQSTVGRFLTAVFGYNANPSLVEVIAYFSYLVLALGFYFFPFKSKTNKTQRLRRRVSEN